MKFDNYEDIIQLTTMWKGERFSNGRPKVSADILNRLRKVTLEEAWKPLWLKGYKYQFEGRFHTVHNNKKIVGRAVTAVMVPYRPDLNNILLEYGQKEENRKGFFNQWVIDSLVEDDVVVADMFDKIFQGTYIGGNLSAAIASRTKRGGAIIWGGIRDIEQIIEIPSIQTYFRGNDLTGIADVTMVGMNTPCRIGNAICMPGDIVFGTMSGVLFIPPHLAEICIVGAEKSHVRDIFGFLRIEEGVYTTAQIDALWTVKIWEDFLEWIKSSEEAAEYCHLTWEAELKEAKERDKEGPITGIRL